MEHSYAKAIRREINAINNMYRLNIDTSIIRDMARDLTSPASSTDTHETLALNPASMIGLDNNVASRKAHAGCEDSRKDCVRNK
jgi:hypothetical protein